MNKLNIALGLIVVLCCISALSASYEPPKFCHRLNCPVYEVVYSNTTANVEYRKYYKALWARTQISSLSYEVATNEGFNRLFDYISGANAAGEKIAMTAPVTIDVVPGAGPFCESTFIVSFYVPFEYQNPQNPPPAPTSSDVYIEAIDESIQAVYAFGGYTWTWKEVLPEIEALQSFLNEVGEFYNPTTEIIAGYNSPFLPVDRHNEIWIQLLDY